MAFPRDREGLPGWRAVQVASGLTLGVPSVSNNKALPIGQGLTPRSCPTPQTTAGHTFQWVKREMTADVP